MKRGRWMILLFLAANLLLLALLMFDAALEKEIAGQKVPKRIIILSPGLTEIAFRLGAGDHVVGVSRWSQHPAAVRFLPDCGTVRQPDEQKILDLEPDIILVEHAAPEILRLSARHAIPLEALPLKTLSDMFSSTLKAGQHLGKTANAIEQTSNMRAVLRKMRQQIKGYAPRRVAIVVFRPENEMHYFSVAAKGNYLGDLLDVLGIQNVFANETGYVEKTRDDLFAEKFDMLLDIRPWEQFTPQSRKRIQYQWRQAKTEYPGGAQEVRILDQDFLMIPGPRMPLAARLLTETVYPTTSTTVPAATDSP